MVERAGLGRRDATTAPTLEELVAENYERLLRVAVLICAVAGSRPRFGPASCAA